MEKHENDGPEPLSLQDPKALPSPPPIMSELQQLHSSSTPIIQRVSDESFVICDKQQTQEHPLGILHVRFKKASHEPSSTSNQFHCPCHAFKRFLALRLGSSSTTKPSRCIHFYICLWAFASNSTLSQEFSFSFTGTMAGG